MSTAISDPAPRNAVAVTREHERGQVIVLFTLAFVVILAVAAIVVDLGMLRTDGARLQNALDAAALAAAHSMPTKPSNVNAVNAVATRYLNQNFSGNWSLQPITYRCLVGVNPSVSPPQPRMTDMPSACNVPFAASSSSWKCTSLVCWAPCDPTHNPNDVCNTIVLAASTTRAYSFGRALGISSGTDGGSNTGADGGSPGNRLAVACTGLCGESPTAPLDVAVIVDRTTSMSAAMGSLRVAANSVLNAYNPAIQRVAFGALGPSTSSSSCGSPSNQVIAMDANPPNVAYVSGSSASNFASSVSWISSTTASTTGSTGLTLSTPTSTAVGDVLVAAISVSGGSGVTITAPNSSWVLINRSDNGTNISIASYYHIGIASEPTTYKWTFGTSSRAVGSISRYTGVDTTTPIDVTGADGSGGTTSSTLVTAPAATTATANARVIGLFGTLVSTSFTAPSGMTERSDTAVTSGPTLQVADYVSATPGTTGTKTATSVSSGRWAAQLFALRAAVMAAPGLVMSTPGGSVGDVLIAGIAVSGGSATSITAPSGWTLIRRTDNSTTTSLATYYRIATGAESSTYTWTVGGSARAIGTISRYSGVNTSSVFDPTASSGSIGTGNTGSSTSVTASGVTTTTAYDQEIAFYATAAATTFTAPSGLTERFDVRQGVSAGPTIESADVQVPTASSTGNDTATAAATGAWAAQIFALRAETSDTYTIDPNDPNALASWIPVGFSGTDAGTPTFTDPGVRGFREAFSSGGAVVSTSHLAQAIGCFDMSGTGTNLATPIVMADKYLMTYGRAGAKKGIIIETDGSPGSCPATLSSTVCNQFTTTAAQAAADAAKADGIVIFTIGYSGSGGVDAPLLGNMASTLVGTSACDAAENTDGDDFFCTPSPTELATIFQSAAAALAGGPHLVQLYATPTVTSVSPATGSHNGGATITVSGTNLADAYSVTFSGIAATSFSVNSATSITVVVPARAGTGQVDIQVSTPGGSSALVAGDKFTYN